MDPLRVLLFVSLISAASGARDVHVESDRNTHLECQGPENAKLVLLEWKREDLQSDGYIFFYRDDRPHQSFQHPMFKGRVKLRDPHMKNGNMSIILYNTTVNDTGTYECRIITGDGSSRRAEIKHEIRLKVRPPGQPGGATEDGGKEDGGKEEEAGFSVGFIGLLMSLGISAVSLVILCIALQIPKSKEAKLESQQH